MAASKLKKSPLTPPTVTPPSIDRYHSYNSGPSAGKSSPQNAATSILAQVASCSVAGRRDSTASSNPSSSPPDLIGGMEKRRSWEDCALQRDGYISFPDFDQLRDASPSRRKTAK